MYTVSFSTACGNAQQMSALKMPYPEIKAFASTTLTLMALGVGENVPSTYFPSL